MKTAGRSRAAVFAVLCTTLLGPLSGCTTVKFVQKNPYTGEIWTVYQHLGSDTITYCPPIEGVNCLEAEMADGPPAQSMAPVAASPINVPPGTPYAAPGTPYAPTGTPYPAPATPTAAPGTSVVVPAPPAPAQ